jgi:hypothetical protein
LIVGDPEQRARELIEFCAGLDEAGLHEVARRSRMVARDVLDLADGLAAERSARVAIQEQRDRLVEFIGKRAHDALIDEQRRT